MKEAKQVNYSLPSSEVKHEESDEKVNKIIEEVKTKVKETSESYLGDNSKISLSTEIGEIDVLSSKINYSPSIYVEFEIEGQKLKPVKIFSGSFGPVSQIKETYSITDWITIEVKENVVGQFEWLF